MVTITVRGRNKIGYKKGQRLKYLGGITYKVRKVKKSKVRGLYDISIV